MKSIVTLFSVTLLSLSVSFAGFKDTADDKATAEYTSVRNLPVILDNEVLSNGRCRLHLDTGVKMDVSCKHTTESTDS